MNNTVTSLTIASALLLSVPLATAQQNDDLKKCASIEDASQRLTCFDNLANKGQQLQRHGGFGLEHKSNADEQQRIDVNVVSRREDPYGNWVITLQNGQVWKQTEGQSYFGWSDDERYYIERGAFNAFYFAREGSNRRFRVERVN